MKIDYKNKIITCPSDSNSTDIYTAVKEGRVDNHVGCYPNPYKHDKDVLLYQEQSEDKRVTKRAYFYKTMSLKPEWRIIHEENEEKIRNSVQIDQSPQVIASQKIINKVIELELLVSKRHEIEDYLELSYELLTIVREYKETLL